MTRLWRLHLWLHDEAPDAPASPNRTSTRALNMRASLITNRARFIQVLLAYAGRDKVPRVQQRTAGLISNADNDAFHQSPPPHPRTSLCRALRRIPSPQTGEGRVTRRSQVPLRFRVVSPAPLFHHSTPPLFRRGLAAPGVLRADLNDKAAAPISAAKGAKAEKSFPAGSVAVGRSQVHNPTGGYPQ